MTFSRNDIDEVKEGNRIYAHLLRARDIGAPATLTLNEWIDTLLLFQGLCAYCRKAPYKTLDHLRPICAGGGTTQSNSIPACVSCNARKGNKVGDDVSNAQTLIEAAERTLNSLQFWRGPVSRVPVSYHSHSPHDHSPYEHLGARVKTTVWLPVALEQRLQNIADKEYRTLSNQILCILEQHFDEEDGKT